MVTLKEAYSSLSMRSCAAEASAVLFMLCKVSCLASVLWSPCPGCCQGNVAAHLRVSIAVQYDAGAMSGIRASSGCALNQRKST